MTTVYDVAEAEAPLSRLLDAAPAGEDVVLARAGDTADALVVSAASAWETATEHRAGR